MSKTKTHLYIPDPHAHPNHHNKRFTWLSKLMLDVKPDVVICAGDLFDMQSLNSFDSNSKKVYDAVNYKRDIEAGIDAQDRLFHAYRKAKKKHPRRVFTEGNHEGPRVERLLESNPVLRGAVGTSDMQLSHYWDDVVPYLEPIVIGGIAYVHYFVSGVMGRAIGGEHPATTMLNKQHMSSTQGHTHTFDVSHRHKADGRAIQGLCGGCFIDYQTDWNNVQSSSMWWSGVHIKRNVDNGVYDLQSVSMAALRKEYQR